jgi:hypothetical protein
LFEPAVVDPVVNLLTDLAGDGGALDLMARPAGMSLRERWSGWGEEPFISDSTTHISVWEKAG